MRPNVLLFTIDALRADHLPFWGYSRDTAPHLHSLMERGVVFTQAFATGPTTPFSVPGIVASVHSFTLGGLGLPKEALSTLAEAFRRGGYVTAGFSPNPFISAAYNYHRGFDLFRDPQNWARREERLRVKVWAYVRHLPFLQRILRDINTQVFGGRFSFGYWQAEEILAALREWLRSLEGPQPFFVWCHFNDVHHPWVPRASIAQEMGLRVPSIRRAKQLVDRLMSNQDAVSEALSPAELEEVLSLYDIAIRYVDQAIGAFLQEVDLEETLVVVTADHGEEFGEHGGFHRNTPYDEMLHVPLILAGGGVPRGKVIDHPVSLLDLAPTLLDLCALDREITFQGESFAPLILRGEASDSRPCFAYYNRILLGEEGGQETFVVRWRGWKLVVEGERRRLFDLRQDPQERKNVYDFHREEALDLERALQTVLERFGHGSVDVEAVDLEGEEMEEIRERLRSLGYLD